MQLTKRDGGCAHEAESWRARTFTRPVSLLIPGVFGRLRWSVRGERHHPSIRGRRRGEPLASGPRVRARGVSVVALGPRRVLDGRCDGLGALARTTARRTTRVHFCHRRSRRTIPGWLRGQPDQSDHRFGNLGYWVRTSATGRGVARAAVRQLADFAFRNTELVRLEIVCAVGNQRSQRVAERAGAVREGVLRDRLLLHGQAVDAIMYSLTR